MRAPGAPRDDTGPVPDALAPPPGHPHFALADGARGVAMLGVIVFHTAFRSQVPADHGWGKVVAQITFGPAVFFILSAFLLYRPFVAARVAGRPRPSLAGYGRNRALRILPAYWFFLTAFALVIGLPGDVFGHWWAYYTQTHIYFPATTVGGLNVSWTLCVELTFYVALPLAVLGFHGLARAWGEARARGMELALLALCIPASWLYVWAIRGDGSVSPTASEYGWSLALPADLAYFAMGMALARLTVALPGEPPLRERLKLSWPIFSAGCWAAALLIFVLRMEDATTPASRQFLNGLVALGLMAPVFLATQRDRGVETWLAWRPVKWLGLVSYGTYLAHYPVLHELHDHGVGDRSFVGFFTLLVVGGGLSLALGTLSYYALEQPILRWKAGRGGARARPRAPGPEGPATAA
jgi:peptidoglycan/LPS O-acetylase OafA/YrhL